MLNPLALEQGVYLPLQVVESDNGFCLGSMNQENSCFVIESTFSESRAEADLALTDFEINREKELRKIKNVKIFDYDLWNSDKLGMTRGDERIFGHSIFSELIGDTFGTFSVKFGISKTGRTMNKEKYETFSGFYTGDISIFKTFFTEEEKKFRERFLKREDLDNGVFDIFGMAYAINPNLVEILYLRILNHGKTKDKKELIFHGDTVEFLEFVPDYSWFLAGPFIEDTYHYGAYCEILTDTVSFPEFSLDKGLRNFYDTKILSLLNLDIYKWSDLSDEERLNIYVNASPKVKNAILRFVYLNLASSYETNTPYRIYIYGNDDASYTKYCYSKKEYKEVLQELRKKTPLLYSDLSEFGFVFTN
jgi:hypothetical protein